MLLHRYNAIKIVITPTKLLKMPPVQYDSQWRKKYHCQILFHNRKTKGLQAPYLAKTSNGKIEKFNTTKLLNFSLTVNTFNGVRSN